ncbi:MAG: WhiB family transcriptional regulator [Egibacteraceae bacterium]
MPDCKATSVVPRQLALASLLLSSMGSCGVGSIPRARPRTTSKVDTALFFPPSADSARWGQRARDACADCPVCAEWLAWALEHGEQGVWADADECAHVRLWRSPRWRTAADGSV